LNHVQDTSFQQEHQEETFVDTEGKEAGQTGEEAQPRYPAFYSSQYSLSGRVWPPSNSHSFEIIHRALAALCQDD
jgi:hypothetical protein